LAKADLFVAHNAKFDFQWLNCTGFNPPELVFCTMIGEYIFARGQKMPLSLEETAKRRRVTAKKADLINDMFKKQKLGFEQMPKDIVQEYAEADVVSCAEVFIDQLIEFHRPESGKLWQVCDLMNDMLVFVAEIEGNGIKIEREILEQVGEDFRAEKAEIEKRLYEIVEEVMGDTPINLASNDDLSAVIYSRRVKDKKLHKEVFNLGTDDRGRPKYPPRMSPTQFAGAVRATTTIAKRQVAHCCHTCGGEGTIQKYKKDKTPYKNRNKCPTCSGAGAVYLDSGKVAGLRLSPDGPADAAVGGFKTDKDTIKKLIYKAQEKDNLLAVEFLTKMIRLNAVSTYISSFVDGILYWLRPDGILHPNFNQTVAATGRLSSSKPNFQNQPKGGKFPVRDAVRSRFKGGLILEVDYSGLEFRGAGELSGDQQIIQDIFNGKDTHKQTATIIGQIPESEVTKDLRQAAKPYTFAPLYGGMGASEPPHVQKYFQEFFNIYKGMKEQQTKWCESALVTGIVEIPSGRQYKFKNVRRFRGGRVSNQTNIVNYPVQGFATGDIVPLACVRALRRFRQDKLKSLLIITVHDSIVVDVYPGELEKVKAALSWAMQGVHEEIKHRWDYEMTIPLAVEMEAGESWMRLSEEEVPDPGVKMPGHPIDDNLEELFAA
jgi:DNA polymerase I-like protein with 3'-5' exonuclease and polymerase domains